MKKKEAELLIRREWDSWAGDNRSKMRVYAFIGYLKRERSDLLDFRCGGTKYQTIQVMLHDKTTD